MAILISCRYDGNDANDDISLLEQGSVISVMSVITIASVLICSRAGLFVCFCAGLFRYCEHIVTLTGYACAIVCDPEREQHFVMEL